MSDGDLKKSFSSIELSVKDIKLTMSKGSRKSYVVCEVREYFNISRLIGGTIEKKERKIIEKKEF